MRFIYLIILILLSSCDKTSKCESAIKGYIEKNIGDPKSYEPIKWVHLDTLFNHGKEKSKAIFFLMDSLSNHNISLFNSVTMDKKVLQLLRPYCIRVEHTFRARNSFNALELYDYYFYVDFDNVVLSAHSKQGME